jgi:hypothetical protein
LGRINAGSSCVSYFDFTIGKQLSWKTIQNYWSFGLRPSSGILETWMHNVSETGSVSFFRWGGRHLLCWVPEKELISITGLRLALSRIPDDGQSPKTIHHRQNPLESNWRTVPTVLISHEAEWAGYVCIVIMLSTSVRSIPNSNLDEALSILVEVLLPMEIPELYFQITCDRLFSILPIPFEAIG